MWKNNRNFRTKWSGSNYSATDEHTRTVFSTFVYFRHEELLALNGHYADMWQYQLKQENDVFPIDDVANASQNVTGEGASSTLVHINTSKSSDTPLNELEAVFTASQKSLESYESDRETSETFRTQEIDAHSKTAHVRRSRAQTSSALMTPHNNGAHDTNARLRKSTSLQELGQTARQHTALSIPDLFEVDQLAAAAGEHMNSCDDVLEQLGGVETEVGEDRDKSQTTKSCDDDEWTQAF